MRTSKFLCIALLAGLSNVHSSRAQKTSVETTDHFPYALSNFPWWSDADLRSSLKTHIPTLGEEIMRGSPTESRIRATLVTLLKEKGIQAEVQVVEPPMDVRSSKRVPEAPAPAIVFSILGPPQILIESLLLQGAPDDVSNALKTEATRLRGRPYSETTFWSDKDAIKLRLQELGYLSSTVALGHGVPKKDGETYQVPLVASIEAGPKYHISSIKADGGPLLQGRDLSPYYTVRAGDVAIPNPFGRLVGALRSTYWHAGYADVDFSGEPVLDATDALASYQLQVIPGPIYHIRELVFKNLTSDQASLAREMLGLKSGDVYDLMAISTLNRKLSDPNSSLRGYSFSYTPKEDKQNKVVDLTLDFYKE